MSADLYDSMVKVMKMMGMSGELLRKAENRMLTAEELMAWTKEQRTKKKGRKRKEAI